MDRYSGYRPVCEAVAEHLGIDSVAVENTGGGCMALAAYGIDGGRFEMLITEAADTLSTWEERQERQRGGDRVGYAVGIYPADENGYCGEYASYLTDESADSPDDVVELVRRALAVAIAKG